jgi:hypothetical protein
MTKRAVVQSHVETLMEQFLETDELVLEPCGVVPVTCRSARYRVRVLESDGPRPHVEVYSRIVRDVDADPGLFEALNTMNRRLSHLRAFWADRAVVLAGEILGETATVHDLACLCDEIGYVAHREGPALARTFGGTVAEPDAVEEGE